MAIETIAAPGAGTQLPFDSVGSAKYPLAKTAFGAEGSVTLVRDADGARLPVTIGGAVPLPTGAATAAAQATANTSLASIDAKLPALDGGAVPVSMQNNHLNVAQQGSWTVALDAPTLAALENTTVTVGAALPAGTNNIGDVDVLTVPQTATTTREYGAGYRASVAATATTFALSGNLTLGGTREVRVRASVAFWLRFGTAGDQLASVPTPNGPAVSIPFDAGYEVIRVPASCTHISVIRDSADGNVTFSPVA